MSALPTTSSSESWSEEQPLKLEVTALIFHGESVRRRRLCVHDTYPSSAVCDIKQKIQELLGGVPDEMQLLLGDDGTDISFDSARLSDYQVSSGTRIKVFAYFAATPSSVQPMEDEAVGLPTTPSVTLEHLPDEGNVFLYESEASVPPPEKRCELKRPPPPLLVQRGCNAELAGECLWSDDERKHIQEGKLFKLSIGSMIFLGQSAHQRHCYLPVSAETKVADVKARLETWLGARPDDLTLLTAGGVTLEGDGTLKDYEVGAFTEISALASYEHACREDLPPKARRCRRGLGAGLVSRLAA